MTKNIKGRKLSKSKRVTCHSFPGATIDDFEDYTKPVTRRKPNDIVIHCGTNNLKRGNPKQIKEKISTVVKDIKKELPTVQVAVSSVIKRKDDKSLNSKFEQVNNLVKDYCMNNNFSFIDNSNVSEDCLNIGGLRLNPHGIHKLAANFRSHINF